MSRYSTPALVYVLRVLGWLSILAGFLAAGLGGALMQTAQDSFANSSLRLLLYYAGLAGAVGGGIALGVVFLALGRIVDLLKALLDELREL